MVTEVFDVKSTGIVRKIDELGRFCIPKEIRRTLKIDDKDSLEIYIEDDAIILKKFLPVCVFCSGAEDLVDYKDKCVCVNCIRNLSDS